MIFLQKSTTIYERVFKVLDRHIKTPIKDRTTRVTPYPLSAVERSNITFVMGSDSIIGQDNHSQLHQSLFHNN